MAQQESNSQVYQALLNLDMAQARPPASNQEASKLPGSLVRWLNNLSLSGLRNTREELVSGRELPEKAELLRIIDERICRLQKNR
jgi:hypothetical protein